MVGNDVDGGDDLDPGHGCGHGCAGGGCRVLRGEENIWLVPFHSRDGDGDGNGGDGDDDEGDDGDDGDDEDHNNSAFLPFAIFHVQEIQIFLGQGWWLLLSKCVGG